MIMMMLKPSDEMSFDLICQAACRRRVAVLFHPLIKGADLVEEYQ